MLIRKGKLISYTILGIALVFVMPFLPRYVQTLAISILIYSIYVGSANLLTGYTGLISLGQAMFWGSAAYATAILTTRGVSQNFYVVSLLSLLTSVLIGATFGALAVRVKRLYFMILTFAFGHVIWSIAMYSLQNLTRGFDGIRSVPRPQLGLPWSMDNNLNFYYLVLVIAVLCFSFLYLVVKSPFGYALVGIRDNEHRMTALGYSVFFYKYICYIVGSIIAGIAGILYASFNGYVNPFELHWLWSGDALMMLFIGGVGTFWGPVVGALIYTGLRYWVSAYTRYWFGIEGVIFVLVVLFFRGGAVGFLTQLKRRLSHRGVKS
jgi:branched-chain amino acid transport system permease protein